MAQTPHKPIRPPLTLTADDVIVLNALLGINLASSEQLVRRVHDLAAVAVEGIEIRLKPGVLQRLKTRALHAPFGPWLADRVREWANNYVGL
jgi:hypothetical protein